MCVEIGMKRRAGRQRAALIARCLLVLLFAWPQVAMADKGRSGHGGSESSHSGKSDSGRGGSDDSDHSGSSSHGGKGRSDDHPSSRGDSHSGRRAIDRSYEGGWRTRIRDGRFEVFDPTGRLVIRRKAKQGDYKEF